MKQILAALLGGILTLTACGQTPTVIQSLPVSITDSPTPSPTPTGTNTSIPTSTPTASITPLPTIPTFTPTFDASTIVTVMPAVPAVCPKENPAVMEEFATPDSNGSYEIYSADDILTYLNSGGTLAQLATWEKIIDLTGNGVNEIIYKTLVRYDILGCKGGKYLSLFDFAGDFGVELEVSPDLNKNGIPELILYDISHYGFASLYVFEWHDREFRSLIDMGTDKFTGNVIDAVSATTYHKLMDSNGDGLKEIVVVYNVKELCGGFGDFCNGTPTRQETATLGWNGQNYVDLKQGNYAPPQYRFQAIQDGDQQARYGNYAEALSFYQAAIFNDRLEWWSPEREAYEIYTYISQFEATPTVYPAPIADIIEYPQLAAHAYYRIMLLHLVQGSESEASTAYSTLQQKFGSDPHAHPYTEMATTFWNAYQSTRKMYDGCAAAIQYAVEHPEILIPLGSDYHGSQSHIYVPADVCPFR